MESSAASSGKPAASPTVGNILQALKECSRTRDLRRGQQIHRQVIRSGHLRNIFVTNTLINMYAKCGSMDEAQKLFDISPERDVVTWNCLIQGYVDNGHTELALRLYDGLEREENSGCVPNEKTYLAALNACGKLASKKLRHCDYELVKWFEKGKMIHLQALRRRCCDIRVETTLVDMYARCGSLANARRVFDKMSFRDVASWNCLIQGYVDNDRSEAALALFDEMQEARCVPDARSYLAAITACASLAAGKNERERWKWFVKTQELHSRAAGMNRCEIFVQAALINLYAQCGRMVEAREVFDRMIRRDVVSWTSLLQGYVDNGQSELALQLYDAMEESSSSSRSCAPDARTYVVAITACAMLASKDQTTTTSNNSGGLIGSTNKWLTKGEAVHAEATRRRACDVFVNNTLIDMYSRCSCMSKARTVFDRMIQKTVVSWNALMQGYVDNGESESVFELFDEMIGGGCVPNARTYVALFSACAALASHSQGNKKLAWLQKGRALHSSASSNSCCNLLVETTLVNMYANCGSMEEARAVFDKTVQRDLVCWNCLVRGYVDNEESKVALEIIACMNERSSATFAAGLIACGNLMAVEKGQAFHREILELGLGNDLAIPLIDFYSKVGNMKLAKQVFDEMPVKDVWAWNSLLSGYSQQGEARHVLKLFQTLRDRGVTPNEVTFTQVLTACSHAGLADKGKEFFNEMKHKYGVTPDLMHYNCLVDVLARSNSIDEALKVVREMPYEANAVTWTTLLGACRKWNNVEVGRIAYEAMVKLDEEDSTAYVLMANIYGGTSSCKESRTRLKKQQTTWTDEAGKLHEFG